MRGTMNQLKASCLLATLVASLAIAGVQQRLSDEPAFPTKGGSGRHATKAPTRKVVPAPAKKTVGLIGIRFEQPAVHAGDYATLRLQLSAPAPKGGVTVMLKAKGLALPKKLTVAEGTSAFELTVKLPKGAMGDYTVQATSKLPNGKPVERTATLKTAR